MNRRSFIESVFTKLNTEQSSGLALWQPTAENPWDMHSVLHLYRRLGYSASIIEVRNALNLSFDELIDELLSDDVVTTRLPQPPPESDQWLIVPPYRGTDDTEYGAEFGRYATAKLEIQGDLPHQMSIPETVVRERLLHVWLNHFVIAIDSMYFPQIIYHYITYLRTHAWGNLKTMVKDITIAPAMLIYLNGIQNEMDAINENYARELLELFLMGRNDPQGRENYSQDDIHLISRTLCGWRFDLNASGPDVLPPYFADYYFDFVVPLPIFNQPPRIYGLAAANDSRIEYDIIDFIFEQRGAAIAYHVCEKIYADFVYNDTTTTSAKTIIAELATVLQKSDWELKPVFSTLFKSEHFFDLTHRGAQIKSPYDLAIGIVRQLDLPISLTQGCTLVDLLALLDQYILHPPNVKGWLGYHTWLNSTTLGAREQLLLKPLILDGAIAPRGLNPRTGNAFDGIAWTDDDVLVWAAQFDGFDTDYSIFVHWLFEFLLPYTVDASIESDVIAAQGPSRLYEWPTLPQNQKITTIRKTVFAITQLAEFQLQ